MNAIEAWVGDLRQVLNGEPVVVSEVRMGIFYTAAQLSTGHVGLAFIPRDLTDTECCPRSAAAAPPAGRLAGQEAWALGRYAFSSKPLRRALGVAVLNALSALAMARHGVPGGRVLEGVDALEAADVRAEDQVAMVGAFAPFIRALGGRVGRLWVVDKHPEALKPDEVPYWTPPGRAAEVLSEASVVFITGSALVEGGMDLLLSAARTARRIVLAGPTASAWPPPFFARGVHIMGGLRGLDGRRLLQLVGEGGSGNFFQGGAEKICVVRTS